MLSIVAGFMIYVSLDELLPASHSSNGEHMSILGVILGMTTMAISLAFLIG